MGGILFVQPGGWGDCSSWARACQLQAALALATAGDEIWAAEGVYKPALTFDRSATFQLKNGVALYGGFAPLIMSNQAIAATKTGGAPASAGAPLFIVTIITSHSETHPLGQAWSPVPPGQPVL